MSGNPVAYLIPYGRYLLMVCLRCAKMYAGNKEPVLRAPLMNKCDLCRATIPRSEK